ncbi:MAG: hypothetical protein KKD77_21580, partial [Gammaproteobacteria bacterium]|nr:hypothetical protein [Gammaproteobacteria bacterium]
MSDSLYFNNAGDTAYIYNHTDTTHLYSENPFSVETSSVTIGGDLSVTGTLGFITGANTGTITGTTSANRAWTIQDSDGTFAWLTDIPAGAGLWSKTFGSTYPTTLTDSVGIGTNTPSEMLEINGNTKIGGDLSVTGVSKLTDSTYFGNWGGVNTVFGDSLWIYGLNGTKFIENYGNNIGSISISSYNNYTDAIGTSINLYGGIDGFIQFSNNNEPNPIVRMFGDSTHFFSEVVVANDLSVTGTGNFGDTAYFNNAGDTAYIYNHTDTNHLYSENPTKINSPSLTLSGGFYPIEWINVKEYGAAGDSATDDKAAIQLAIDAITADGNGTLFFPEGYYNLESGVTIDGKRNVKIWGQNAVIINGNVSTTTLINIDDCKEIEISGIDIDMGSVASACSGIKVDSCFSLNVNHCDFYNYGQWNAYGLNLSYIASAESAGFEDGFLKINNCSFYNPDTITVSTYDYNSNNTRGSGIYLNSGAEYGIISNNNFDNLSCAVFSHEGANTTFTNNIVRHINHVDNGVIRTTAGIYIDDSGNNGKWNISHNKFNHNYGAIFYSIYDVASNRPIQIINNEFIANAFDPIRFNSAATFDYNNIIGNEFDRCYDYGSFLNYPFTGNRAFIKLAQINYSKISDNTFTNSNGYAIITYANCGYNYIKDNIHETITTAFDSLTGTNDNIYNN